jgi:hypothetical protein
MSFQFFISKELDKIAETKRRKKKGRKKTLFCQLPFFRLIRHTVRENITYIKTTMIMWCSLSALTTATLMLITIKNIQGTDWMDYGESSANVAATFDDDSDQYISALTRDEEQEIHSPLITGFKYVSGNVYFK